ncbi:MAG: Gfo/Idh/MocA family oxidoreductase [Candidatus Edwardsbacteria bacterium]|nr:Gfo/Idh/MocA family oxidoreductase [Candidatus Edwardsbacteria bacterium]MBU1576135.1 Gfo/Idh/MocA family oxidoreductase [Candidatus Edwardsbacteria bacterium]MBU2463453.1 Gfo/Idh/MocA family oxidoreductase [Candidatus Edwardsbacteria bacterium]MBU2593175.1 Gfo/Idh/MocA family oxidoreductase [Candidatus Edwardsbacteria bacterium]
MSDIKVAVVGCGQWGTNQVRTYASLPGASLAWLVDASPKNLQRAKNFSETAKTAGELKEALQDKDLQAVVIATNSESHHALAKMSLEAGKHVMVEKPLALNVKDAKELVKIAKDKDLILMTGHLLLYHPAVRYLKELVNSGELGQILYLYSTRVNLGAIRKNENALWSLAPHDISVMLYLMDQNPDKALANGKCFLQKDIEDVVFFSLDFPGGQVAQAQVSWLDPHKIRKFTVVGSKKMVTFDDMEATEKIRIYDKGVNQEKRYGSYDEVLTLRDGDIHIPYFKMQEPLKIEAGHFIECINEHKKPLSDGQNGLDVVKILAAVSLSLKEERAVKI